MNNLDKLLADIFPRKNESSRFLSSQASVSTTSTHRSRLSLSFNNRPSTGRQQPLDKSKEFAQPAAPDQGILKRKHLDTQFSRSIKNVFCAKCGLPERLLIHTLDFHVSTCKGSEEGTEDCPSGEKCSSTNIRHFRTHRHRALGPLNIKTRKICVEKRKESWKKCVDVSNNDERSFPSCSKFYEKYYDQKVNNQHVLVQPQDNGKEEFWGGKVNVSNDDKRSLSSCSTFYEEPIDQIVNNQHAVQPYGNGKEEFCGGNVHTPNDNKRSLSSCSTFYEDPVDQIVQHGVVQPQVNRSGFCVTRVLQSTTCDNDVTTINNCSSFQNAKTARNDPSKQLARDTSPNLKNTVVVKSVQNTGTCKIASLLSESEDAKTCNVLEDECTILFPPWSESSEEEDSPCLLQNIIDPMLHHVCNTSKSEDKEHEKEHSQNILSESSKVNYNTANCIEKNKTLVNHQPNVIMPSTGTGIEDTQLGNAPSDKEFDIHSASTIRVPPRKPRDDFNSKSPSSNIQLKAGSEGVPKERTVSTSKIPCLCHVTEAAPSGEVCANLMVKMTPSKKDTAYRAGKSVAVNVNATCCISGWKAIEIDVEKSVSVHKVEVCECSKKLVVNCAVADTVGCHESVTDFEPLQTEFLTISKDFGITTTSTPSKNRVQLSIRSFLTERNKKRTPISEKIDDDQDECISIVNSSPRESEKEKQQRLQKVDRSKAQWQDLMKRNKARDFTYVSAGSSTDGSSNSEAHSTAAPFGSRKCPFYKKIPETTFAVDAFNHGNISGIDTYFLSHFHFDHYVGLRRTFSQPIYCTKITASLVCKKIGVNRQYLKELSFDEVHVIKGVQVTALEANHCPGSAMFLFQLANGKTFLHVGDFRADPVMESYPAFWNLSIDKLFLDTTYCSPQYTFPSQSDTISEVVRCVEEQLAVHPKTLFVCGAYTIGKEKVFIGIAEAINAKLWANAGKRQILNLLEDPAITSRLTTNPFQAQVHVCEMKYLTLEHLQAQLKRYSVRFTHIMAFKPSGFEHSSRSSLKRNILGNVTLIGVSYSEHSSFTELRRFVKFVKPKEVIPTVNVGRPDVRKEMQQYFDGWLQETRQDIRQFFASRTKSS